MTNSMENAARPGEVDQQRIRKFQAKPSFRRLSDRFRNCTAASKPLKNKVLHPEKVLLTSFSRFRKPKEFKRAYGSKVQEENGFKNKKPQNPSLQRMKKDAVLCQTVLQQQMRISAENQGSVEISWRHPDLPEEKKCKSEENQSTHDTA